MKFKKQEKRFSRYDVGMYLSFLLIVVLGVAFAIILYRYSLSSNVKNRAAEELQATSQMQAAALTSFLEAQYQPLREIESMLLEADSFSNEAMRPVWQAMVNANRLCMLALADTNGDVTNYMGEQMGNIGDRSYFSDIADGEAQQSCEYLSQTKSASGPRVMFSIPIYQNDVAVSDIQLCA